MVTQIDATVERNKATFRLLQEQVIARGRLDLVEQVFAPTFRTTRAGMAALMRVAGLPEYPSDGTVYERFIRGYRGMVATLADQERIIDELSGEGDTVWSRWRIRATHAGEFMGRPPTGERIEFGEVGMMRFDDDGRMVEGWFMCDELDLAVKLGIPVGS